MRTQRSSLDKFIAEAKDRIDVIVYDIKTTTQCWDICGRFQQKLGISCIECYFYGKGKATKKDGELFAMFKKCGLLYGTSTVSTYYKAYKEAVRASDCFKMICYLELLTTEFERLQGELGGVVSND